MIQPAKPLSWKVFAASMAAGLVISLVLAGARGRFTPERLGVLIVIGLFLGAWLFFSAWTWRRLAAMRDDGGRYVYDSGVLAWGIPVWITLAVVNAASQAGGLGNALSREFAAALLVQALIGFPLALWGGWFFGKVMARAFGTPHQSQDPR